MKVVFTQSTQEDFKKYGDYIQDLKRSNPRKYEHLSANELKKQFRGSISNFLGRTKEHTDSIFPDKFDYNHKNYKMYVDKKRHHIIFYKVKNETIKIYKCIHSVELKKELDKENIKPLKDADPKLLLDYMTVEKEDKVKDDDLSDKEREEYKEREAKLKDRIADKNKKKAKSDNDDEGEETEATDPKTGKKVKLVSAPPGPRGGPRVKVNGKGKIRYRSEFESKLSLIPITEYLQNSKMKSLTDYIQENL